jgi:hypothetical protein
VTSNTFVFNGNEKNTESLYSSLFENRFDVDMENEINAHDNTSNDNTSNQILVHNILSTLGITFNLKREGIH